MARKKSNQGRKASHASSKSRGSRGKAGHSKRGGRGRAKSAASVIRGEFEIGERQIEKAAHGVTKAGKNLYRGTKRAIKKILP
jgi:hypothetical protein